MVDLQTALAAAGVRRVEPAGRLTAPDLAAAAALHRRLLPWTPTSRAGLAAVRALYEVLAGDPAAVVLVAGDAARGGFAAGTTALRATEALVRRRLLRQPAAFLRVAVRHLSSPAHLLAARAFGELLPPAGVGYVLTIGVTPDAGLRGRALLAALEGALLAAGARELWVDTEEGNAAALRLYAGAGYQPVARRWGQVLLRKLPAPPP